MGNQIHVYLSEFVQETCLLNRIRGSLFMCIYRGEVEDLFLIHLCNKIRKRRPQIFYLSHNKEEQDSKVIRRLFLGHFVEAEVLS